ncbi:uncharacterized protein LOC100841479 [Brachypodium distachyon]|uniref:AB hydrolase-1 domain-containing protein n=1 Tax=Brachypodium distachyon TaxID=15368 RepID=I1ISS4_BRADI|nr:uncharacterized protein LOC100841479 [Brachypodium distachyon]PNT65132.1 hypothetical protein BRADI_4g37820v3 [Brachypodium distachyon]|eukprot:XP_003578638.1 uncharacterized protein LOC100841479 [Brachypodium distachyon]
MVNWVQVQRKYLLCRLAKNAGLRQHAVAVDDAAGTVVNFWLPEHKAPAKKKKNATTTDAENNRGEETEEKQRSRHAVVLVHGFAGDGLMTWAFQMGPLGRQGYDVYVPDLVHFCGSSSAWPSPETTTAGFQAASIAAALGKLGVERCTAVGFSYGGLVAFEMAAARPGLVRSVVVSGSVAAYTGAMNDALLARLGARTTGDLMLPESVAGVRRLFSAALHMKMWMPARFLDDFLKVMYSNRKERAEMLENSVTKDNQVPILAFQQDMLLLWGESDKFFPIEDAKRLREELGEKAILRSIRKAGHLAHLERPCVYNRYLKEFLARVNAVSAS